MDEKRLIKKTLKELRNKAKNINAKLIVNAQQLIDDRHLHPFWYFGQLGSISYRDWKIVLKAGDDEPVAFTGRILDVDTEYKDAAGLGAYTCDIAKKIQSDAVLYYLMRQDVETDESYIRFTHKPSWHIYFEAPDGCEYDPSEAVDVGISHNATVLEALKQLPELCQKLEEFIALKEAADDFSDTEYMKNLDAIKTIDRMMEHGDSFTDEELAALRRAHTALDYPLRAFVEEEVATRVHDSLCGDIREQYGDLAVTAQLASFLAAELYDGSDVMFDYDALDSFLMEKTGEYFAKMEGDRSGNV